MPSECENNIFVRAGKLISPLYYLVFLFSAVITAITFAVGYAERFESEFSEFVKRVLDSDYYLFLFSNRYQIIFIFLPLFISYILFIYFRKIYRWKKVCRLLDDFQARYGDQISHLIATYGAKRGSIATEDDFAKMSVELQQFIEGTINEISKIFRAYTGKACHASIKTYSSKTEIITTRARDIISDNRRHSTDEALDNFQYKDNTAFKIILDNPRKWFFKSNHLRLRKLFGLYINKNKEWCKYYRATLVTPITKKSHPEKITKNSVWGFLCVDNKWGGFDGGAAPYLLSSFSRIYVNIFYALSIYKEKQADVGDGEVISVEGA